MSTDPYATTSTVKNILQHVISPKIVNDGAGGYVVKTDLVNIDSAVINGGVSSSTNTVGSITINGAKALSGGYVNDITINVNSGSYVPRWAISRKNPDTSGSSGSDFCVQRFDDAGGVEEAINIQRSNFSTTVRGPLTVNGNTLTCNGVQATNVQTQGLTVSTSGSATATVNGTLTATNVACTSNLQFPTAGGTAFGSGNLVVTNGNYTFGTNQTDTSGYALFNNTQAGIISWTGNSVGTRTVAGLNSSSIVTLTPSNSGGLYGDGNFSVDTNTADTLRVYTQNSGSYTFNYFVARF